MKIYSKYNSRLSVIVLVLAVFSMSSCIKNMEPLETDFSGLQKTASIPEGGFANFANTSLSLPPTDDTDTLVFHVNYASKTAATSDVTFTLAVDNNALSSYNSGSAVQYEKFPDSIYSFTQTTVTVSAGNNYATVKLVVHPSKVDPTRNYMLPISIVKVSDGTSVSGNFATIYYHFIGNPLAGIYNWDFTRWNTPSNTGTPSGLSFVGYSTILSATSPTSLEVASGYFTKPRYEISFTNNAGVISNFQVSLNNADIQTMAANGVTVTNGPNILLADPIAKIFTFQYTTNARYIIDSYYK
ncbi:MAG: DUF1735 domain-containing protein [Bacteroidota bacterium]|nr:DUF1735 domain-containing protein [Bacteroidota bacterium]